MALALQGTGNRQGKETPREKSGLFMEGKNDTVRVFSQIEDHRIGSYP